jgi:hypothetical protein
MKKRSLILFMGMIMANSFAQQARQHCCSSYNFFSDAEIYFIRDSMVSYRLDIESEQWTETNFYAYFYDDNLKIKDHVIYVTDPEDLLRKRLNRYEYEYRKEELEMTRVGYSWDADENSWVKSTLAQYNYDSTFAVSERLDYYWNQSSGDWIFNYDNQFIFDGEGPDYDSYRAKWDPVQQAWMNDAKTTCSLNPSFKQKTCLSYQWRREINDWIAYQRKVDYYDESGMLQKRVLDVWDQGMLSWKPFRNFYYLYDQYGREDEWLSFGWDEATGKRVGEIRQRYAYDDYGNKIETLRYGWAKESDDWILSGKQVEYWTDLIKSSRIGIGPNKCKIYPQSFQGICNP